MFPEQWTFRCVFPGDHGVKIPERPRSGFHACNDDIVFGIHGDRIVAIVAVRFVPVRGSHFNLVAPAIRPEFFQERGLILGIGIGLIIACGNQCARAVQCDGLDIVVAIAAVRRFKPGFVREQALCRFHQGCSG
jgi:hypothetical protein